MLWSRFLTSSWCPTSELLITSRWLTAEDITSRSFKSVILSLSDWGFDYDITPGAAPRPRYLLTTRFLGVVNLRFRGVVNLRTCREGPRHQSCRGPSRSRASSSFTCREGPRHQPCRGPSRSRASSSFTRSRASSSFTRSRASSSFTRSRAMLALPDSLPGRVPCWHCPAACQLPHYSNPWETCRHCPAACQLPHYSNPWAISHTIQIRGGG